MSDTSNNQTLSADQLLNLDDEAFSQALDSSLPSSRKTSDIKFDFSNNNNNNNNTYNNYTNYAFDPFNGNQTANVYVIGISLHNLILSLDLQSFC